MTSWSERYLTDETLRAFVDARIIQAGIDVQAAQVEHERDQDVIKAQRRRIEDLTLKAEGRKFKAARSTR